MRRRDLLKVITAGTVSGLFQKSTLCSESSAAQDAKAQGKTEITWSKKIPVRYDADVAVIGGGIAGVSAACAAAKSGARVVLVERFAVAGGMLTTGGVANFCGQMDGQGEVFNEIVAGLKAWKAVDGSIFHYEILAVVLQELLLARKVKLLLHTRFVDCCVKEGQITEAIVCGKSGPEALRARQFIDCTGDADVARTAGFSVVKGRPSDGLQLPMSIMYFVRHLKNGDRRPMLPDGWFKPIHNEKDMPMVSIWPDGPGSNAIKVKIPMFDSTDTESITAGEIQARRRMMEVMDYHQDIEKKEWMLDHCSPIIGIREGCRITGDYVLKVDDLRAGRKFDDAIARGTFYLDGHKPDDDKRTYILPKNELKVPPYQIPMRSFVRPACAFVGKGEHNMFDDGAGCRYSGGPCGCRKMQPEET